MLCSCNFKTQSWAQVWIIQCPGITHKVVAMLWICMLYGSWKTIHCMILFVFILQRQLTTGRQPKGWENVVKTGCNKHESGRDHSSNTLNQRLSSTRTATSPKLVENDASTKSIFNLVWPWPLTSWPPKLTVHVLAPWLLVAVDNKISSIVFKISNNKFGCMDERTGWEHNASLQLSVCGGIKIVPKFWGWQGVQESLWPKIFLEAWPWKCDTSVNHWCVYWFICLLTWLRIWLSLVLGRGCIYHVHQVKTQQPNYTVPADISWARCHGDCFSDDKRHTSAARRVTCVPWAVAENV